jgi:hypothetical protein
MKRILSSIALAALLAVQATGSAAYAVRPGDTLSSIASRYGTTYPELARLNGIKDPDLIHPGQELLLSAPASSEEPSLGALPSGRVIPDVKAGYVDSLQAKITADATSFTLVRGTDGQDRALSGTYGFTFEEGTTNKEYIVATCSGTSCTVNTRGIDLEDGTTSVSSLKKEHRRAAEVKITDYPLIAILKRMLNGETGASSTFMLGDGTATANKYLKSANGSANLPFIRYNETSDRWEFSDDGLNTVTFSTSSGSGLSASTTKGVFITASQVGVNASTTGALAFDSNGYLYVSPTFRLPASFLSALSVSGTATFGGTVRVPTTTGGDWNEAANVGYVQANALTGSAIFGTGYDGDATISANTTFTRPMFYRNLTISSSAIVDNGGFPVYVSDVLTRTGTAKITNNGIDGTAGANGSGGGAGSGGAAGALPPGIMVAYGTVSGAGSAGGASANTDGNNGNAALSQTFGATTSTGVQGGAGGNANPSSKVGGSGGGGGGATYASIPYSFDIASRMSVTYLGSVTSVASCFGSGGGGGGASGNASAGTNFGGGGGGAGSCGGDVAVFAKSIVDSGTGPMFQAKGGKGASGGNGYVSGTGNQGAGGGGGGAGGNGGLCRLFTHSITGNGYCDLSGGAGGAGGSGASFGTGSGASGATGTTGASGTRALIQI